MRGKLVEFVLSIASNLDFSLSLRFHVDVKNRFFKFVYNYLYIFIFIYFIALLMMDLGNISKFFVSMIH